MSGYICPVCWSTRNDCPCNKNDRLNNFETKFLAGGASLDTTTSTVNTILENSIRAFYFLVLNSLKTANALYENPLLNNEK